MLFVFLSGIFTVIVAFLADGKLIKSKKKLKPEISRKIVHVTNYVVVATWPFFTTYKVIIIVELIFLLITIIARKYRWFGSVNNVYRITWGEQFGAIGVIIVALLQPTAWVFATAMFYVGIADAVAALVGKWIGRHTYEIFGNRKTIEGSLAFFTAALLITIFTVSLASSGIIPTWQTVFLLPIAATVAEGIAPYGLDNLLVPILAVLVLNRF